MKLGHASKDCLASTIHMPVGTFPMCWSRPAISVPSRLLRLPVLLSRFWKHARSSCNGLQQACILLCSCSQNKKLMNGEGWAPLFCLSEMLSMTVEALEHSESHLGLSILQACTVKLGHASKDCLASTVHTRLSSWPVGTFPMCWSRPAISVPSTLFGLLVLLSRFLEACPLKLQRAAAGMHSVVLVQSK